MKQVVKMGVGDEFSIKIQLESQLAANDGTPVEEEDFAPFGRIFQKDKETIDFLSDQL